MRKKQNTRKFEGRVFKRSMCSSSKNEILEGQKRSKNIGVYTRITHNKNGEYQLWLRDRDR